MATVAARPDGSLVVSLTAPERRVLTRDAARATSTDADLLARYIEGWLQERATKQADRRAARLEEGYARLSATDRGRINNLIPGVDE